MIESRFGGASLSVNELGLLEALIDFYPYTRFWGEPKVTYSFASGFTQAYENASGGSLRTEEWTASEREIVHDAFDHIETFADVSFSEIPSSNGGARIPFGANIVLQKVEHVTNGWAGFAAFPNPDQIVLVIDDSQLTRDTNTIIHEIGHALGLEHPFDGAVRLPGVTSSASPGDFGLNNELFTTMAYNRASIPGDRDAFVTGQKQYASPLDIAALQFIYGANTSYNGGDDVYTFAPGRVTIWDTGGWDMIDASDAPRGVRVDLRAATLAPETGGGGRPSYATPIDHGGWEEVDSVLTIAYGVVIEGIEGSAQGDLLIGNGADNRIIGHGGGDEIFGDDGDDLILGWGGDDTLNGGLGIDTLDGGSGTDTAQYFGLDGQGIYMIVGPDGIDIGGPDYDGPSEYLHSIEKVKIEDRIFDLALYEGAATLGYEELADVAKLYTAYFNRAPAAEGLLYWGTRHAEGMSLAQMAQSFFVQPEAQALYGNVADPGALVDAVFQNLLGRLPAADGRTYWSDGLKTGEVREATLVLAVINGAEAPTGSPGDAAYLRDKADIGLYFAGLKGLNARDRSDDVLALYDGTQEGLIAARDAVDAIHADEVDSGLTMPMVGVIADPFADLV